MVYTSILSTQEVSTRVSQIQAHPGQLSEFKVSLDYITKACLTKTNKHILGKMKH